VDACLGAYLLPWLEKLGYSNTKWDFSVPGVTSISADVHKYGYGPKGASAILYTDSSYRRYQFYSTSYWSGGLYCSPSMTGSRAGGIIAAAWTDIVSLGQDGFEKAAKELYEVFQKLLSGIRSIEDLEILGQPIAGVIAFKGKKNTDVLKVADAMEIKGWKNINRLQRPSGAQIQVGHRKGFNCEQWLQDLKESVEDVKNNPDKYKEGMAAVYGMAGSLPPDFGVIEPILDAYLDAMYQ